MNKIKVVQFGLGPIGIESAARIWRHPRLELVGAIDVDPGKVGRDVGELFRQPEKTGIIVSNCAEEVLAAAHPRVVVHTTQSSFKTVLPQLQTMIRSGADVVSSTEELLFPYLKNPELAKQLDAAAKSAGVAILGTGVNPGFVMDTLVLLSTAVCAEVKSVKAERFVEAGLRRLPLQKKVGAGLSVEEFRSRVAAGTMGHVGMKESVALIAHGLNWHLDEIRETIEPVVADRPLRTSFLEVHAGEVAGIHNTGSGLIDGRDAIKLDLRMYVGCPDPHDSIQLESDPPISLRVNNGIFGDLATVAMLINCIPSLLVSSPGLKTMLDIPIPRHFA